MTEEVAINPLLTGQGSLKLTEKGEALIEAKLPATFGVPGPKLISVSAEITDLNQQTIAGIAMNQSECPEYDGHNIQQLGQQLATHSAVWSFGAACSA